MASTNFINECKNRANANRLGKIIVDGIETPITNSNNLQSFEIDSGCYVDGNIIGSVYAKCLKANFIDDQNNLTDKSIQAQIGVKYADLSNEYINMGKYTVERPNNEITANMSQITAYDDLYTNLDKKYVCNIDYSSGDKTVSDLYADVCEQLGLTPVTTTFTNSTIPIADNPFTNGEKNRTVLQTVAKISCSFIDIDDDTNKIDLCWLSDSDEPDYVFNLNDYSNVEGGKIVCGPINCLIIKNSQIDDENVTIKDDESIATNGEHSITISEDYILYNADLRQQAINAIWNKVKGMKYVDCKLTTYYGKPFLKLGKYIRVYIGETEYFDTYVLKHNFTFDGTFTSVIESPAPTEQEIKTKQDISLGEALRNTQIEVNKQKGEIRSITTKQENIQSDITNNYYNKTSMDELLQTAESGITNTFSEAGGNNIFRNTGLQAAEEYQNPVNIKGNTCLIENSASNSKIDLELCGKSVQAISANPVSPSPDYPSEITNIAGNVKIELSGKNRWNNDLITDVVTKNTDGFTITNIWANGVLENQGVLKTFKPSTKYTIKIRRKILAKPTTIGNNTTYDLVLYKPGTWYPLDDYKKYETNVGDVITTYRTITTPTNLANYRVLCYSFYGNNDGSTNYVGSGSIEIQEIMVVEGSYTAETFPQYEAYQGTSVDVNLNGNVLTEYDKLIIKDGKAIIQKKSRNLSLAIADMNNGEDYPGWRNVAHLGEDYPDKNISMITFCNYKCNIRTFSEGQIGLNSMAGGSTLFFQKGAFALTQTQWKEQYPDLVFNLIYELAEPYEIDLGEVTTLKTFNGTTYITNSEDAEMKIEYQCSENISFEFWNGNVVRSSNENSTNGNSMLLQNGTLSQDQEVPNGNYSISFWYKKLISQAIASVVINDKEYQLNSTDYKQFYTGEQDSETKEYITEPIVVTTGHLKIEFKCNANGGVEVYDLMANKGTVKLAYSQNANETTTETVNISKGITIISTNMETIFKANANGIKILTLQKETIAYFTDKGLSTNELIVKNKAQMCGTLVSEVGDQTWFTRM